MIIRSQGKYYGSDLLFDIIIAYGIKTEIYNKS